MGTFVLVPPRESNDDGWCQMSSGFQFEKEINRAGLMSAMATVVRWGLEVAEWKGALQKKGPRVLGSYKLFIVYRRFISQRVDTNESASLGRLRCSSEVAGLIIETVERP